MMGVFFPLQYVLRGGVYACRLASFAPVVATRTVEFCLPGSMHVL